MRRFDVIVVGSGCGLIIANEAAEHDLKVALVDKGPFGGTCLNNGCIPSKILIYTADRAVEAAEADRLGVSARVEAIDFPGIMERMRHSVGHDHEAMLEAARHGRNPRLFEGVGRFTGEYEMEVNGSKISAEKIFLASGSRPSIPPINGLDTVDYLTSETLLQLKERPESLIIIGGGYVGVEYAHFFAAMGTRVSIIEMADRLVLNEEPDMARVLQKKLSGRMDIYTNHRIQRAEKTAKGVALSIVAVDPPATPRKITAEKLLVAAGRVSNADLLEVKNAGIETDKRGFIVVNDLMETNKKGIFAVGDANGQHMFTHVANREAFVAAQNMVHEAGLKMSYRAVPHAVYSHPQMAAVGMREAEARADHEILVGVAAYRDVAKGDAMLENDAFAKAIVDREKGKLLGFHIIGPMAPELIQEVTNAMAEDISLENIGAGMHIHPALAELIPATLNRLEAVS